MSLTPCKVVNGRTSRRRFLPRVQITIVLLRPCRFWFYLIAVQVNSAPLPTTSYADDLGTSQLLFFDVPE